MFDQIFWISISFIFLSAVVGVVVSRRQRDRCLKLLDDFHVTMEMTNGRTIWGDLKIYAQGLEIRYDAPYKTEQGVIKSGYLFFENELGNLLALCRYVGDQTEAEKARRTRQVQARFKPGYFGRVWRWICNVFNTIRDAFSQAMSHFVGTMAKTGSSAVVSSQKGQLDKMGKNVLTANANTYEPMLEDQIGKPVVLELAHPGDPEKRTIELPGYLAEYSDKYLALFNVEHAVTEMLQVDVDKPVPTDDIELTLVSERIVLTNQGDMPIIIEGLRSDTGEYRNLGVVLTTAASARLAVIPGNLTLEIARVQCIDLVCPRAFASIRYSSMEKLPENIRHNLPPAHEDQHVEFP